MYKFMVMGIGGWLGGERWRRLGGGDEVLLEIVVVVVVVVVVVLFRRDTKGRGGNFVAASSLAAT